MSIYDYKIKTQDGKELKLDKYRNKVLLIVNTAIKCDFTSQYEELEALYEKYHDKGFEILDFPCNQFKEGASDSIEEINKYCKLKYNIKFTQFDKISVNGENALPLYSFLKRQMPEEIVKGFKNKRIMKNLRRENESFKNEGDINWNFTKFLINREGNVIKRYSPTYIPSKMEDYIRNLLKY